MEVFCHNERKINSSTERCVLHSIFRMPKLLVPVKKCDFKHSTVAPSVILLHLALIVRILMSIQYTRYILY